MFQQIQHYIRQFQKRHFSSVRYNLIGDEIITEEVYSRRDQWVIPRSQCVFKNVRFPGVPKNKRSSALQQQLLLISPFSNTDYRVQWSGEEAKLWLWDADKVLSQVSSFSEDIKTQELEFYPESVLLPFINDDGVRLYKVGDSFIGQVWLNSSLKNESCWFEMPSGQDWNRFLQSAGQNVVEVPATVAISELEPLPWLSDEGFSVTSSGSTQIGFKILTLLLALVLCYQIIGLGRLFIGSWYIENEIRKLDVISTETVALRKEALVLQASNSTLRELNGIGQLYIMEEVANALPESATDLSEWVYKKGDLEFFVYDENPDLQSYVLGFESVAIFSNVKVEPFVKRKQVKVVLTVSKK